MNTSTKTSIKNLHELEAFAVSFLKKLDSQQKKSVVVALSGDLGAGKTTLVQKLAEEMGVKEIVTSPTFTIMKSYQIVDSKDFEQLVHIDAYRIESLEELRPLHLSEVLLAEKTLVCIEWAERIKEALPATTWYLNIKITEGESREITVSRG